MIAEMPQIGIPEVPDLCDKAQLTSPAAHFKMQPKRRKSKSTERAARSMFAATNVSQPLS
jgi:hypothetical protein